MMKKDMKINLGTKISYIICLIILGYYLSIKVLVDVLNFYKKNFFHDLGFKVLIVLIFLSFIICSVCSIINYKKNNNIRKKISVMYITLITILTFSIIIPNKIYFTIEQKKQNRLKDMAKILLKESSNKNNYIFLYNDLKMINKNINEFDENSYMLYRKESELYICLEYKTTTIYGSMNDLRFSRYRSCEFNPRSIKNEYALKSYLRDYLENKYSIKVTNIEKILTGIGFYTDSYIRGTEKIDRFEVYYDEDKKFNAYLEFDDINIIVTDDYIS